MDRISPVELVITHFGVRPLARSLGIAPSTVLRWRESGRIPSKHIPKIKELSENAFTSDELIFGR